MSVKNLLTSLLIAFSYASYGQFDCGCPTDIDPVCAQDSIGNYVLLPNECLAECWGFTVVTDTSLCDIGGSDCLCTQEYAPVCVTDSLGNYFEAPNACYAECWGLTIVTDSTLCDHPFTDCECEIIDSTSFVCAQDSLGNVYPVPNACFAECWGLTVVEGDCIITPWEGCDCPIDENEPFVCALDSVGHTCFVPNACFAECWGLTIVGDSLCDVIDIEPEIDIETMECMDSLEINESTTFQQALIMISQNCGLELPQCIVDAPLFESDSLFFMYIIQNCDDLGFNGNAEGSNVMNLYNMVQNSGLSSVKELSNDVTAFELSNNPVSDHIQYKLNIKNASNPVVRLMDIHGAVVSTDVLQLSAGNHVITKDISTLKSGMYFLSLSNGTTQVITRKVIVIE